MSRLPLALTAGVALLSLACGRASTPAAPELTHSPPGIPQANPVTAASLPTPSAGLGGLVVRDGTLEGATGLVRIQVDPEQLMASVEPLTLRAAQATDDQYELDISVYFAPTDIKITGVVGTATTVDVSYAISHPFAAPSNLASPATAANRADLGISGRVLYLVDTPSIIGSIYFSGTDSVTVNTKLVGNADGYYKPNDLLDTSTFLANTFPYQALVNETLDPRSGISNSGVDAGNYTTSTGWQGSNIGANRNGWTGYGMLHQGQAVGHTISLNRASLGLGFSFDVAVLAKYTDPRGGISGVAKRANRLPSSPADITKFVYRAPHSSLDVERVRDLGEGGGFVPNVISASQLRFHVVDWDARATETSAADLSLDTDIQMVPSGASGAPSLSVCIPGVLGDASVIATLPPSALTNDDSAYGGDVAQDSGAPADPLFYTSLVTKTVTSGQVNGTYTGLVRVADPELNLASRIGWYFPLNGSVVPPLPLSGTDLLPEPVVYQAFEVLMSVPNINPSATFSTPATVISGLTTTHTVQVTSATDGDGNPITVEIDWDGGANSFVVAGVINSPYTPLPTYTSPAGIWANSTGAIVNRTINVRFSDGVIGSPINAPNLTTALGANRPPQITGGANVALAATTVFSGQSFTMNAGTVVPGTNVTDPEGNAITYRVYDNITPGTPKGSGASFPITGLGPYLNPGTPSVTFTTYATDALHPTSATGTAMSPARIGTVNTSSFAVTWGIAAGTTQGNGVCLDSSGNAYVVGSFTGTVDFDPGSGTQNRTSAGVQDAYCLSLNQYGVFRWVATVGGTGQDFGLAIADMENGNVALVGQFVSVTGDFDPGAGIQTLTRVGAADGFLLHLTQSAGAFVNVAQFSGGGAAVRPGAISKQPGASRIAIGGSVGGNMDVDPGPGVQMRLNAGSFDGFYVTLDLPATYLHGGLIGGTATDQITDVAMASDGTTYVAAQFQGTADVNPTAGTSNLTSNGSGDAVYSAVTLAGAYVNNRRWGGTGNDAATSIVVTSTAVLVSGQYANTVNFNPYGPAALSTSAGVLDAFVTSWPIAFGSLQYHRVWGSTGSDVAPSLAVTSAGAVRVGGSFEGTVDFDPGAGVVNRTSGGLADAYALGLTSTGDYEWIATWGGTGAEATAGVVLNSSNEPRMCGTFGSATVDFDPGAGTQTRSLLGVSDAFLLGLQPSGTW